jgi:superkiller protein 3
MWVSRKTLEIILALIFSAVVIGSAIYFSGFSKLAQLAKNKPVSLFDSGNLSGAVKSADAILANDPNNVAALLAKATALAQEGSLTFKEKQNGEEALAIVQKILAIDPKNDEALRIMGYAHEIMQEYPEAHAAYQQALAINPQNAKVISQDAHAWDLQGDFVKAEAGYRAALAIDPTLDQAQFGLGRIDVRQGHIDEALTQFNLVAKTTDNANLKSEAAYSAGIMQGAKKMHTDAEASMRTATAADPGYALAWVGLGKEVFYRAMSTPPTTPATKNDLIKEAIGDLQKAIAIDPNQSQAYLQLGMIYGIQGQQQDALKTLDQALAAVQNDITLSAPDKEMMTSQIKGAIGIAGRAIKK